LLNKQQQQPQQRQKSKRLQSLQRPKLLSAKKEKIKNFLKRLISMECSRNSLQPNQRRLQVLKRPPLRVNYKTTLKNHKRNFNRPLKNYSK
tara:strand:+ start:695 stop:967 length:273 start_codon:yes stop_codon:yes gene_type:complete